MKVLTKEHREKIGAALRGRKFSEEHSRKKSLAQMGEKNPSWRGGKSKYVCLNCQTEFYRYLTLHDVCKFCSLKCTYEYRTRLPEEKKCEYCGNLFKPKEIRQRFCNQICGGKGHDLTWIAGKKQTEDHIDKRIKREDQHYGWKGGIANVRGYVFMRQGVGKYKEEHRIIAEKALGRSLKRCEHIHHINGDHSDNRNCNLLICDRSYHAWLHRKMGLLYQREHFSPKPIDYVSGVSQISESVSEVT